MRVQVHSFAHGHPVVLTPFVEKTIFSLWDDLGTLVKNQFTQKHIGLSLDFQLNSIHLNTSPYSITTMQALLLLCSKFGNQKVRVSLLCFLYIYFKISWRPLYFIILFLFVYLAALGLSRIFSHIVELLGFPDSSVVKESARNAGDPGLIPGSGRSAGEGNGYPLQYSGLENSMDCVVHGVTKNRTRWSDFHFHFTSELFSCDMGGMGSSSPTRGRTQVPCIGSIEF